MPAGKGYPVFSPQRTVPTNDNEPLNFLLPNGQLSVQGQNGNYQNKRIFRIVVDLTDQFFGRVYNTAGTLIWFSGQTGGTAAPMDVTLDNVNNDPFQMVYDRAVSGIPFSKFYLDNPTAQPGVTMEFTIVLDSPSNRVGLNG